jgi:chromatin remodeling complex protein RSC6
MTDVAKPQSTSKSGSSKSSSSKSSSSKKKSSKKVSIKSDTDVVAPVTVVDVTKDVVDVTTVDDTDVVPTAVEQCILAVNVMQASLLAQVVSQEAALKQTRSDLRTNQRLIAKMIKELSKRRPRRQAANKVKREASGFAKPCAISNELCTFLKLEQGTMIGHTEVTKKIHDYIKENKLKDSTNGRQINPNKQLAKLFSSLGEGELLTYFTLQKHLKHHFIKNQS